MIKARKGLKNPREKVREILTEKEYCLESQLDTADVYIGEGLKIIIDFSDKSISWLVPERRSQYYIGRILPYDPELSGNEIAEMIMDGAEEIGRREEVRE